VLRAKYPDDDDIFIPDEIAPQVPTVQTPVQKPVIINQTINVHNLKPIQNFNVSQTARVKTAKPKQTVNSKLFDAFDSDDE
jgi:hypothetical protein